MNIFEWQNFAYEFYAFINNWMIATGKELPDKLVKIKLNIDNLNKRYTLSGNLSLHSNNTFIASVKIPNNCVS